MAPPLSRPFVWPLAAAVAFIFVVGLALHGERPDAGVASFKPAGVLTAFAPDQAREIEIVAGVKTWRFRRDAGWKPVDARQSVPADAAQRIDVGLRLLHDSAPLRVLTAAEIANVPASEYALGPGSLRVRVDSSAGAAFRIQFGGRNPLGAGRYARVDGVDGIPILPAYVAEAWEQIIGGPPQ